MLLWWILERSSALDCIWLSVCGATAGFICSCQVLGEGVTETCKHKYSHSSSRQQGGPGQ